MGTALAGRQVRRDRDAEFRAWGTVARSGKRCATSNSDCQTTSNAPAVISPVPSLMPCASSIGPGRRGTSCSSVTKNWRNTTGTWNLPAM